MKVSSNLERIAEQSVLSHEENAFAPQHSAILKNEGQDLRQETEKQEPRADTRPEYFPGRNNFTVQESIGLLPFLVVAVQANRVRVDWPAKHDERADGV
jgi:hypothetical protein